MNKAELLLDLYNKTSGRSPYHLIIGKLEDAARSGATKTIEFTQISDDVIDRLEEDGLDVEFFEAGENGYHLDHYVISFENAGEKAPDVMVQKPFQLSEDQGEEQEIDQIEEEDEDDVPEVKVSDELAGIFQKEEAKTTKPVATKKALPGQK